MSNDRLNDDGAQLDGQFADVTVDDTPIAGRPGDSVAAALVRNGRMAQRRGPDGQPHGHFCGMGTCFECLVEIDGTTGQRACMTPLRDGMRIRTQTYRAAPRVRPAELPVSEAPAVETPETLVIGGGPAGLEAARIAAGAGCDVLLLDERTSLGGQFYKQLSEALRGHAPQGIDRQMRDGESLIAATFEAGVRLETGSLVWFAGRQQDGSVEFGVLQGGRYRVLRPRTTIVATGAMERPYPVPGWTLPGVMTTGGVQTLLRSYRTPPGGPVLVAGNGPLNLQLACELLDAGVEVCAVVEAGAPFHPRHARNVLTGMRCAPGLLGKGAAMMLKLKRAGVKTLFNHAVARIVGDGRVSAVELAAIGDDGELAPDRRRRIAAATVALGYGFVPQNEILRLLGADLSWNADDLGSVIVTRDDTGATSIPGVFAVGEAGSIGGAHIAMMQGRLAGCAAARHLGRDTAIDNEAKTRKRLYRHRQFQDSLWRMFGSRRRPLAGLTRETVLCRCEDIAVGACLDAARDGNAGLGSVKRQTRAGMGRCQGRYCGPVLRKLLDADRDSGPLRLAAPQNPVKPVSVHCLSREKPEWGGHRRVPLPALIKPQGARYAGHGDVTCDVAVIGGGIVGACTALFLARAGADVVVLESGEVNNQASGGNAGSLHVQLLSFDFGSKAEAGGGPAARTLPLQQASARLWETLATELPAEMEFSRQGGLMVADSHDQLRFLEDKTALERKLGISCEVVDADDARRILPGLADHIVGGAWCPEEGKINPLLATAAVADAARGAGARILTHVPVQAVERDGKGWTLCAPGTVVRTGSVVNAAGPWGAQVARMMGHDLPVFGTPLQMIVTEAAEQQIDVLLSHADRHLTLKQAANGNILIGGGWPASLSEPYGHPRPVRASIEGNLWAAEYVLPGLSRLNVIRSWSAVNTNIDGAPIIGPVPGAANAFTAVTSSGYTLGPIVGRITADLVLTGKSDWDLSGFTVDRFKET